MAFSHRLHIIRGAGRLIPRLAGVLRQFHVPANGIRAADIPHVKKTLSTGIVGLPNVGKSTLFNALTNTQLAEAANYPFTTIDPNIGKVSVPDERLKTLAGLAGSQKIISSQLEFVDIAGLVRGASQGEGLGNKFLANIRDTQVIMHVLRAYEDENVQHVDNKVDPVSDLDTIELELSLADLAVLERRRSVKPKKGTSPSVVAAKDAVITRIQEALDKGTPAREVLLYNEDEIEVFRELGLITGKPVVYICNVKEEDAATGNEMVEKVKERVGSTALVLPVSARLEEEVSTVDEASRAELLEAYGLETSGLAAAISASDKLLRLQRFYTVGPIEARSWIVSIGTKAPGAAGVIHTDFERGFIRAEVISYDQFVEAGGEEAAKTNGWMRLEGKDYVMQDGDVCHFRFNV